MIMKKCILTAICAVVLMVIGVACTSGSADSERRLTVSIEPQRYLLERIVGDRWQVGTLLEKGSDPENFDPTTGQLRAVSESEAYFTVGTIPFEQSIARRVGEVKVVDTSVGIGRLEGTHLHCHDDGDGGRHHHAEATDPHIWSSLPNARQMAANMLEAMIEIDPAGAEYYTANYAKLDSALAATHDSIATVLKGSCGREFLIWHPSLSYFARDYDLHQIALGADNRELTPQTLKDNIDRARGAGTIVMFTQPDYDHSRSDEVARQAGASTVEVNLLDYDFPAELMSVAKAIAR